MVCGLNLTLQNTKKMKRVLLAVLFGIVSLSSITTKAQVNININIGSQPDWGPTGYDHVDYYYLPDVDAYYYVPTKQYVYLVNGTWAWRNSLPTRYSGYNLYNGYKVVMNNPKPYLSHQTHVKQYSKYKNYNAKQAVIRDSRESKYVNARSNNATQNNRPAQTARPAQRTEVRNHTTVKKDNKNNVARGNTNSQDHNKGRAGKG